MNMSNTLKTLSLLALFFAALPKPLQAIEKIPNKSPKLPCDSIEIYTQDTVHLIAGQGEYYGFLPSYCDATFSLDPESIGTLTSAGQSMVYFESANPIPDELCVYKPPKDSYDDIARLAPRSSDGRLSAPLVTFKPMNCKVNATLTVTMNSSNPTAAMTDSTEIVVYEPEAVSLAIDNKLADLYDNTSHDFSASCTADAGTVDLDCGDLTWSSSPASMGSIDASSGLFTPSSSGTVTITASRTDHMSTTDSYTVDILSYTPPEKQGLYLWRGFHHSWTYNHRLNALGSIIDTNNCKESDGSCNATITHTGRTGSGADTANHEDFYSFVTAPKIDVHYETITLHLNGKEKNSLSDQQSFTVPVTGSRSVAVINGYDLQADDSADQPDLFSLEVTSSHDSIEKEVTVDVQASGVFDCSTPECPVFSNVVDYTLTVNVAVISAEPEDFDFKLSSDISNSYSWDDACGGLLFCLNPEDDEIFASDHAIEDETIQGTGSSKYDNAAMGLTKISIDPDEDYHFLQINTAIHPQSYDSFTGRMTFDVDLFFKQWSADNFLSPWVFQEPGEVTLKAKVALLQFAEGKCVDDSVSGTFSSATGINTKTITENF